MINNTIRQLPKPHRFALLCLVCMLVVILILPSEDVVATKSLPAVELKVGVKYPVLIPTLSESNVSIDESVYEDFTPYLVRKGDTLAKILGKHGQGPQVTYKVSNAGDEAKRLITLKPGETLYFSIDEKSELQTLRYPIDNTRTLVVKNAEGIFTSTIENKQIETLLNFAKGTIQNNFWNAGTRAGLTDNQIMQLAGIFGWDIDFAQEIRTGDSFNIVFEELFVDGEFVGFGNIVAAEFINQGDEFVAIRYTDGRYYTPDGRSMRKSFLRAPIDFRYVSSNFNPRRFHPVQKRIKPHRGVDYVARIGTPVVSAGDGKVIKSSYDKYNGHHVFIQHGERYQTKYLHFKKRAVKVGQSVKQGQVIGYLGRSGMVTGAHLHYEFLVDGVHRNPRTVSLPKAEPIDAKEKNSFMRIAARKTNLLENHKRIMLAMN